MLTPTEWHQRFQQQAQWTRSLRDYLFKQSQMDKASRVLEIGCGTGAVLKEIQQENHGIDIDFKRLKLGQKVSPRSYLICADAYSLPYPSRSFDISFGHYLLLWLKEPLKALIEMTRITKPGGYTIAIAEPDYGGRIDYPDNLQELGKLQVQSLKAQGADPLRGRELKSLFSEAGLKDVETGVLNGHWSSAPTQEEWEGEWRIIENDLENIAPISQLEEWKQQDLAAWDNKRRVLFVPTFYAIGRAP